jgi:hypothetical protein
MKGMGLLLDDEYSAGALRVEHRDMGMTSLVLRATNNAGTGGWRCGPRGVFPPC